LVAFPELAEQETMEWLMNTEKRDSCENVILMFKLEKFPYLYVLLMKSVYVMIIISV